jgi:hypothetical protein
MNITEERANEILNKYNETDKQGYKLNTDLFNWCEEYKNFISSCVSGCVSMEVEYILKKSYEDNDTPLSYEDLDLFDKDKAIEYLEYKKNENGDITESYKELQEMDKEQLKELFNKYNLDTAEAEAEVLEWWIIQDPLKYRLEQEGEIFLKGGCVDIWARTTTGQSISLDSCCINAFINLLKDRVKH